jgi:AcrR family transcriptional regulator
LWQCGVDENIGADCTTRQLEKLMAKRAAATKRSRKTGKPTKERLLDAAERLFARKGFYGVSIRDITRAAKTDVSMANYHFGSKQNLLAAVVARRAEVLNDDRLELLEETRRRCWPAAPTPEQLIEAFLRPISERARLGDPGWNSYFALVAEVNNSSEWSGLMTEHYDRFIQAFMAALAEAMPGCPEQDLYWGYHFFSGALTLTFAQTGRIDRLSQGLCQSSNVDELYNRMITMFAGGFRALAANAGTAGTSAPREPAAARPSSAEPTIEDGREALLQHPPRLPKKRERRGRKP